MILKGKVALVTGAGRGLGRAHALALAAAGAQVVVNDLGGSPGGEGMDAGPAQEVVNEIAATGGVAIADTADISSWFEAGRLVEHTLAHFGRLDILVNNAGICRPTAFGSLSELDWDRLIDVNAKGTAALIEAATRHWRANGPEQGRAIVNTASPAGANPHIPLGIYGVSKAAVLALTQVAAQELASLGVRVNALAPVARTRMLGAAMAGQPIDLAAIMPSDPKYDRFLPDHIARLVLYLVSPLCRFTGRLFGVRADDIFIYSGWDARHHVDNGRQPWTLETLAAALANMPLQERLQIIAPPGGLTVSSPSDETLMTLQNAIATA
jgi:NAD(P)-dependent dehydrogenase (short-subunit alcohol dehydrogenase family)